MLCSMEWYAIRMAIQYISIDFSFLSFDSNDMNDNFFFYLKLSPQTPMQRTQKLLASKGASFINAVSCYDRVISL